MEDGAASSSHGPSLADGLATTDTAATAHATTSPRTPRPASSSAYLQEGAADADVVTPLPHHSNASTSNAAGASPIVTGAMTTGGGGRRKKRGKDEQGGDEEDEEKPMAGAQHVSDRFSPSSSAAAGNVDGVGGASTLFTPLRGSFTPHIKYSASGTRGSSLGGHRWSPPPRSSPTSLGLFLQQQPSQFGQQHHQPRRAASASPSSFSSTPAAVVSHAVFDAVPLSSRERLAVLQGEGTSPLPASRYFSMGAGRGSTIPITSATTSATPRGMSRGTTAGTSETEAPRPTTTPPQSANHHAVEPGGGRGAMNGRPHTSATRKASPLASTPRAATADRRKPSTKRPTPGSLSLSSSTPAVAQAATPAVSSRLMERQRQARQHESAGGYPPSPSHSRSDTSRGVHDAANAEAELPNPTDWLALQVHLRNRTQSTHIVCLDFTGLTTLTDDQWSWLCREIVSQLRSLEALRLVRMELTDRRVGELLQGCQVTVKALAAPPTSSSATAGGGGKVGPSRWSAAPAPTPRGTRASSTSSRTASAKAADAPRTSPSLSPTAATTAAAAAAAATEGTQRRSVLPALRSLDVSGNRLTHRSATHLGKLILWAADTLDEVRALGNPLKDYGFQVLGIYLAKLQLDCLQAEPHLFPPTLVTQYATLQEQERRLRREERLRRAQATGSAVLPSSAWRGHRDAAGAAASDEGNGDMMAMAETEMERSAAMAAAYLHLGLSVLDVRDCRASARGISALLAGASAAHRLTTIIVAHNVTGGAAAAAAAAAGAGTGAGAAERGDAGRPALLRLSKPSITTSGILMTHPTFSNFEQLRYPSALREIGLNAVPLSQMCSPAGCRELLLNLFFCCPHLTLLDVSESFEVSLVPDAAMDALIELGLRKQELLHRLRGRHALESWQLFLEQQGEAEFTVQNLSSAGQTRVGDVLCELIAHATFNATTRHRPAPPAFAHVQELHLNGTGLSDVAVLGLCTALRSAPATGMLRSLSVLNLADNLLTANGCASVVTALVVEWPTDRSQLMALALQNNIGVTVERGDGPLHTISLATEAALARRLMEAVTNADGQPTCPLTIQFGPAAGPVYYAVCDAAGVAHSTFPGAQHYHHPSAPAEPRPAAVAPTPQPRVRHAIRSGAAEGEGEGEAELVTRSGRGVGRDAKWPRPAVAPAASTPLLTAPEMSSIVDTSREAAATNTMMLSSLAGGGSPRPLFPASRVPPAVSTETHRSLLGTLEPGGSGGVNEERKSGGWGGPRLFTFSRATVRPRSPPRDTARPAATLWPWRTPPSTRGAIGTGQDGFATGSAAAAMELVSPTPDTSVNAKEQLMLANLRTENRFRSTAAGGGGGGTTVLGVGATATLEEDSPPPRLYDGPFGAVHGGGGREREVQPHDRADGVVTRMGVTPPSPMLPLGHPGSEGSKKMKHAWMDLTVTAGRDTGLDGEPTADMDAAAGVEVARTRWAEAVAVARAMDRPERSITRRAADEEDSAAVFAAASHSTFSRAGTTTAAGGTPGGSVTSRALGALFMMSNDESKGGEAASPATDEVEEGENKAVGNEKEAVAAAHSEKTKPIGGRRNKAHKSVHPEDAAEVAEAEAKEEEEVNAATAAEQSLASTRRRREERGTQRRRKRRQRSEDLTTATDVADDDGEGDKDAMGPPSPEEVEKEEITQPQGASGAAEEAGSGSQARSKRRVPRVRSFVLSYVHPEGHLLCRAMRWLQTSSDVGALARTALEADVLAFLQPPPSPTTVEKVDEGENGTAAGGDGGGVAWVVQQVRCVPQDSSAGVLKLEVTTNERRATIAGRLQDHLNVPLEEQSTRFPHLLDTLYRADDHWDLVERVEALVEGSAFAKRVLEEQYHGSADFAVHLYHNGQEEVLLAQFREAPDTHRESGELAQRPGLHASSSPPQEDQQLQQQSQPEQDRDGSAQEHSHSSSFHSAHSPETPSKVAATRSMERLDLYAEDGLYTAEDAPEGSPTGRAGEPNSETAGDMATSPPDSFQQDRLGSSHHGGFSPPPSTGPGRQPAATASPTTSRSPLQQVIAPTDAAIPSLPHSTATVVEEGEEEEEKDEAAGGALVSSPLQPPPPLAAGGSAAAQGITGVSSGTAPAPAGSSDGKGKEEYVDDRLSPPSPKENVDTAAGRSALLSLDREGDSTIASPAPHPSSSAAEQQQQQQNPQLHTPLSPSVPSAMAMTSPSTARHEWPDDGHPLHSSFSPITPAVRVRRDPEQLSGKLKTFALSYAHREGAVLCRGWRLLHRSDELGERARCALEADFLSILQPPDDDLQHAVTSVRIANDSGMSNVLRLEVESNERWVPLAKRLEATHPSGATTARSARQTRSATTTSAETALDGSEQLEEDTRHFPRFTQLVQRCFARDTLRVVDAYLSEDPARADLRQRLQRSYRSLATFVHYYHGTSGALAKEIGVASMEDLEAMMGGVESKAATPATVPGESGAAKPASSDFPTSPKDRSTAAGAANAGGHRPSPPPLPSEPPQRGSQASAPESDGGSSSSSINFAVAHTDGASEHDEHSGENEEKEMADYAKKAGSAAAQSAPSRPGVTASSSSTPPPPPVSTKGAGAADVDTINAVSPPSPSNARNDEGELEDDDNGGGDDDDDLSRPVVSPLSPPSTPSPNRVSGTRYRDPHEGSVEEYDRIATPRSSAEQATPRTVGARDDGALHDPPLTGRPPPTARTLIEPREPPPRPEIPRAEPAGAAASAQSSAQSEWDRLLDSKYRRLLRVAYDSMGRGSIPLEPEHQQLVRIGKGKWGEQRVSLTLEWELFLVMTFEKPRSLGSTKRAQMLVHPVACGFTPRSASEAVPGGSPKHLILRIQRPYSPDEVGVSSGRMVETLCQGAAFTASTKVKKRDKAEMTRQARASEGGGGGGGVATATDGGFVSAEVRQLMERNVTIEVAMDNKRQVEDAVQLLQRGVERASDAIRKAMQAARTAASAAAGGGGGGAASGTATPRALPVPPASR